MKTFPKFKDLSLPEFEFIKEHFGNYDSFKEVTKNDPNWFKKIKLNEKKRGRPKISSKV